VKTVKVGSRVTVLYGGFSSEREISLITGTQVSSALRAMDYDVTMVDVPRDIKKMVDLIHESKPDVVFNALHGKFGEDGSVQGVLDMMRVPYTNSGRIASSIAMHKIFSKKIFSSVGLPVVQDHLLTLNDLQRNEPFSRPYVIKPLDEGSSVGVFIINDDFDISSLSDFFSVDTNYLMAEEYIPGRELTVAVLGDKSLAVTEIQTRSDFYNYSAKYSPDGSSHILPAKLNKDIYNDLLDISLSAHQSINCRGVSRVDFRLDGNDPYILEINTQPGLTPTSLVPEQAAYVGISFNDLISWMMENAACDS